VKNLVPAIVGAMFVWMAPFIDEYFGRGVLLTALLLVFLATVIYSIYASPKIFREAYKRWFKK